MSQLRYPVVLFDVGGTLLGPRDSFGAVYARVLRKLGVSLSAADLERGLRQSWVEFDRTHPPGADRYRTYPGGEEEYWLRFVERTLAATPGAPTNSDLARRALLPLRDAFARREAWQVFPDTLPALDELRSMGARMGVVSNWDSRLPRLLDALGLAHYFEVVAVSHLEGVEKPDPEIFHRAISRLGARAEEALHVGDTPALDDAGATAAGVACVLVHRGAGPIPPTPAAISALTAIPAIAR